MTFWATLLVSGIATYLTRVLPLTVSLPGSAPAWARRYLDALPIAIIAALAVAAWRRNLLFAVIAGVLVVAGLRAIGL